MGRAVFPPCCLTWDQTVLEVMKIMVTPFKRSHAHTAALNAPDPAAGHRRPMPLSESPGHSQAILGQSLVESLLLFPGSWCSQGSVFALQRSVSPVLCEHWQFCDGVNGDILQEGLCHTQSPCLCCRPLPTHISAGDTQILKSRSVSVSVGFPGKHKVLLESSKCLWQVWGLILNAISPLWPSCWGFSFALDMGCPFLVGSNVLLSMVGQQRVVILEFSQKKMSARPPILTSCSF